MTNVARLALLGLLLCAMAHCVKAQAAAYGPYSLIAPVATDGDTIKADIAIFPHLIVDGAVRVIGVDTPEINGKCVAEKEGAKTAKTFVDAWLKANAPIVITSVKADVYPGRYDAIVLGADGSRLSDALIKAGLGRIYNGGKRQPWCN